MVLYRGVSEQMDKANNGEISSSGTKVEIPLHWDDPNVFRWDDQDLPCTAGSSEQAMLKHHQSDNSNEKSGWISTTKSIVVAKRFATTSGMFDGWVYELEADLFDEYGVIMQPIFHYPDNEGEEEISIRVKESGPIPQPVITNKFKVLASGGLGV